MDKSSVEAVDEAQKKKMKQAEQEIRKSKKRSKGQNWKIVSEASMAISIFRYGWKNMDSSEIET